MKLDPEGLHTFVSSLRSKFFSPRKFWHGRTISGIRLGHAEDVEQDQTSSGRYLIALRDSTRHSYMHREANAGMLTLGDLETRPRSTGP